MQSPDSDWVYHNGITVILLQTGVLSQFLGHCMMIELSFYCET